MTPERTPTGRGALATTLLLGLLAAACASPPPPVPLDATPLAPGALRARLFFGETADLDLYVTGPDLETVYFGNSPTRLGGALTADVRCDAPPGPRVETVDFARAPAGAYRIGIDFPERCGRRVDVVPFLLVVEADDLQRRERGEIGFGTFLPTVLEIELPGR